MNKSTNKTLTVRGKGNFIIKLLEHTKVLSCQEIWEISTNFVIGKPQKKKLFS